MTGGEIPNKQIEKDALERYNASRDEGQIYRFCHAPFRTMFLGPDGTVNPCCANRSVVLGKYPEESIRQIWTGEGIQEFRKLILQNDLSNGCEACSQNLRLRNYGLVAAKRYDVLPENPEYPVHIDFNLSNICNLECVMCDGWSSSSIMKNRYHLENPSNPYDENFVEEMRDFFPHLVSAFFIGGEPFLIPVFFKLWEALIRINPECGFFIQTNGTVLNDRIKTLMEKGKFFFNVSLDSLNKETFESIRLNANLGKTLENLDYFIDYCRRKNTSLNLTACPMQQNKEEIPELVEFANRKDVKLYFNTVLAPRKFSFFGLKQDELQELISIYSTYNFPGENENQQTTRDNFLALVEQMKNFFASEEISVRYVDFEKKQLENIEIEMAIQREKLREIIQEKEESEEINSQLEKIKSIKDEERVVFILAEILDCAEEAAGLTNLPAEGSKEQILNKLKLLEEYSGLETYYDILRTIYTSVPVRHIVIGLFEKDVRELFESYLSYRKA